MHSESRTAETGRALQPAPASVPAASGESKKEDPGDSSGGARREVQDMFPDYNRMPTADNLSEFKFGPFPIPSSTIFLASRHSVAFTNLKCFRPGHVLIAPKQPIAKFQDLPPDQRTDLLNLLQNVILLISDFYHADRGLVVTLQDGKSAGMSVEHVHFHVIPKIPFRILPRVQKCYSLCVPLPIKSDPPLLCLPWKRRPVEEQTQEAIYYKAFIGAMTEKKEADLTDTFQLADASDWL